MWGQKYGTKLVFIHFFYSSMFVSSKMCNTRQIETVTESLCQGDKLTAGVNVFLTRRDREVLCFHCVTRMFILFSLIFQKPAGQRHVLQVGPMWVWRLGFSPRALLLSHFSKSNTSLSSAPFSSFLPFIWLVSLWACCSITWEIFVVFCSRCLGLLSTVPRLKASHWCPVWNLTVLFRFSPRLFSFLSHVVSFISLSDSYSFFFFSCSVCSLYTRHRNQTVERGECMHTHTDTHKEGLCIIQAVLERRAKTLAKACSTCFTTSLKLFGNQLSEYARHIFSNWTWQPTPSKEPSHRNDQYVSLGGIGGINPDRSELRLVCVIHASLPIQLVI